MVFDLESLSQKGEYKIFNEFNVPFSGPVVSPDGKYITAGFNDDKVYLIDLETFKIVMESPKEEGKIQRIVFSKKGFSVTEQMDSGRQKEAYRFL